MASRRNGTLYVGVTSDIGRRASERRTGGIEGFTKRYGCTMLVWFEPYERMDEAIIRESRLSPAAGRTSST
jgi:putative endonuclease